MMENILKLLKRFLLHDDLRSDQYAGRITPTLLSLNQLQAKRTHFSWRNI